MKKLFALILVLVFAGSAIAQYSVADIMNKLWAHNGINIAKGESTGKTAVEILGRNAALSTTYETVTETSGVQGYLNHASVLDVVSGHAQNDTAGTGIRTITIYGLDDDWGVQSEVVTLAASATVQTTAEFLRVFRVDATTAGSGGVAAANILIQNTTNDTTLATIPTGGTGSNQGMFSVPAGKTLYGIHFYGSTASGVLQVVTLWERLYGTTVWLKRDIGMIWLDDFNNVHTIPITFTAKSDIEIRAKGNTGNVSVCLHGWYE